MSNFMYWGLFIPMSVLVWSITLVVLFSVGYAIYEKIKDIKEK